MPTLAVTIEKQFLSCQTYVTQSNPQNNRFQRGIRTLCSRAGEIAGAIEKNNQGENSNVIGGLLVGSIVLISLKCISEGAINCVTYNLLNLSKSWRARCTTCIEGSFDGARLLLLFNAYNASAQVDSVATAEPNKPGKGLSASTEPTSPPSSLFDKCITSLNGKNFVVLGFERLFGALERACDTKESKSYAAWGALIFSSCVITTIYLALSTIILLGCKTFNFSKKFSASVEDCLVKWPCKSLAMGVSFKCLSAIGKIQSNNWKKPEEASGSDSSAAREPAHEQTAFAVAIEKTINSCQKTVTTYHPMKGVLYGAGEIIGAIKKNNQCEQSNSTGSFTAKYVGGLALGGLALLITNYLFKWTCTLFTHNLLNLSKAWKARFISYIEGSSLTAGQFLLFNTYSVFAEVHRKNLERPQSPPTAALTTEDPTFFDRCITLLNIEKIISFERPFGALERACQIRKGDKRISDSKLDYVSSNAFGALLFYSSIITISYLACSAIFGCKSFKFSKKFSASVQKCIDGVAKSIAMGVSFRCYSRMGEVSAHNWNADERAARTPCSG